VPFDTPGLSRIFCNIHPQMTAYVMAVETPYFAVSDASGRFVIRGVPAGSYRYHAWRAGGALLEDSVSVGSSEEEETNTQWLSLGLERLPVEQRMALELTYTLGHSCEEVAAILDCPVNTVKTRLFRARETLKQVLPELAGMSGEKS